MILRLARPQETAVLAEVEAGQPRSAGWGKQGFDSEIPQACSRVFCAEENGKVLGFLALRAAGGAAEILNVAVDAQHCGRGVGWSLLRHALLELGRAGVLRVTLEVAQDNVPACALYAKGGFSRLGTRKNFYGPGRHAWVLGADL